MGAVYPRWRGEHMKFIAPKLTKDGLSPLARGTLSACPLQKRSDRFIPAGAGNTCATAPPASPPPVYPRWRGEHTKHTYLFLNKFIPHQQSTN
nr:hypothetical protein EC90111_0652 [Escherichia coli 9.0111]